MVKKKITESVVGTDIETKRWRSTFAAARLAYDSGELKQAQSLLSRTMELAEKLPAHSLAKSATEIGSAAILIAQGKAREAAKILESCICELNSYSDAAHRELLAVALRFHAQSLEASGDERTAEKELLQSADILSSLGSDASVQVAYTLSDLCGLYVTQGRQSEAETHIIKALKILSTALGPEAPEYTHADMIYQVCTPMQPDSRMESVTIDIRRMEYAFGGHHPNLTRALNRYLRVLEDRGDHTKIEEARQMFGVKFGAHR